MDRVTYYVITGAGLDTFAPTAVEKESFDTFEEAWEYFEKQTEAYPEKSWDIVRQRGTSGPILQRYRPKE